MFAIVKTGGKQYKVQEGAILKVEKLEAEGTVTFNEVLLTDDGKETVVGKPTVAGVTVTADVVTNGRAKKIRVVHFKNKTRFQKTYGHRQPFTQVKVKKIEVK